MKRENFFQSLLKVHFRFYGIRILPWVQHVSLAPNSMGQSVIFARAASLIELTVHNIVGVEHHVDVAGVRALVSVPPDMQPIQMNKIYVIHIFSSNLQEIN